MQFLLNEFRHISIFSRLSEPELKVIEQFAVLRSYKKNSVIITEGDISDSLYVIQRGRVKVHMTEEDGREIIINDLGPSDYFGELAILDGSERSASITTTEDSQLIVVSKEAIIQLLKNPDTALLLIQDLVSRVRKLSVDLKDMALKDVYTRLVKLLHSLVEEIDGEKITTVPLTQEEIANRIGSARESVARILNTLKSGGYISYRKKFIIIERSLPEHY